jgi:putative nucleotidyltransferase with HDIG domain
METSSERRSGQNIFGVWRKSDFLSLKGLVHSPLIGWFFFLFGCILITLILAFQTETLPTNVRVGSVAPKDIKADQNYEVVDEKSTQKNREEALKNVLPVYDYDEAMGDEIDHRIQEAFEKVRNLSQASTEEQVDLFERTLGIKLSEDESKVLTASRFKIEVELLLRNLIRISLKGLIIDDTPSLQNYVDRGIVLRRVRTTSGENETVEKNLKKIQAVDDVRGEFVDQIKKIASIELLKGINPEIIGQIASRLIRPNVSYNVAETELRKAKAVAAVKPVIIKIQAGESIIRSGDRYDPWHLVVLHGIQQQKKEASLTVKFVGTFLFVALLVLVTYSFASRYIRKFHPTRLDLIFLGATLVTILVLVRIFSSVTSAIHDSLPFEIEIQALYYTIPVSAGAMLVRLILNSEAAIIFGILASALAGIFLNSDAALLIYFLVSSIVAAGSIAYADRRSAILKAGVLTGFVNAFVIFTIKMVQVVSVTEQWAAMDIFTNMVCGILGGMNSSLFVLFFTPVAEMLFGYTTDIKLLEMGNLNHPLLKEMIVAAPGTYHHSQLVAVLAEAAAQSIGANPILARVGAYFHDVGKMKKPLYFIENQMGGENRHDKLTPSMSALIISSHVKDGVELAEQYKLPKMIIEMIPQHQGTKLITYFYNKAKDSEQSDLHEVKEQDYRYPGPRPQTREAGILLLADGVEAAVRSMPDKSPPKIQGMVQKIINKSFVEEQLEECDLTLKDLRKIADSFLRVLIGIYHQRIAYPEEEEQKTIPMPIRTLEVTPSPKVKTS